MCDGLPHEEPLEHRIDGGRIVPPIKPENRHRYPKDWKTRIRPAILERAAHRCEWCGKPNGVTVEIRSLTPKDLFWFDQPRGAWRRCSEQYAGAEVEASLGLEEITRPAGSVKVVLTIAHLDHTPENCEPSNLRALCQRCHLSYDKAHHQGQRAKAAAGPMLPFEEGGGQA